MEITRLQPFPLVASVSELNPETDYVGVIYDDHFQMLDVLASTSDEDGNVELILPEYFLRNEILFFLYFDTICVYYRIC